MVIAPHARADARGRRAAGVRRKLEITAAWGLTTVVGMAAALGFVGPRLGGLNPGLPGLAGFVSETIVAMWAQIGALAGIAAGAALVRGLRWQAAALGASALLLLGPDLWAVLRAPAARSAGDGPALRVAAVNLAAENEADLRMEQCVRRLDADVLVLCEFTTSWAERLEPGFEGDYPYRWLAAPEPVRDLNLEGLRIAVWSRLPPAGDHEVVHLSGVNSQIRVPLRWRGSAFALYGIHPWKPYPFRLYGTAWRDREQLLDWIRAEPLPTIVAGDFNAPPRSAFLLRLRACGLSSASETICGRAPVTWPMHKPHLAPFRVALDHVMHGEAFIAVGFERGMTTGSDHAPVVAELAWRER